MEKVDNRREKIYEYIVMRINAGSAPTVREICADLHISSTSTVHSDLKHLTSTGMIEMIDGLNRTIRLPGASAVRVPLIGAVAAGRPILAMQDIETYVSVGIPSLKDKEAFALRVKGDSMIKVGILDGDIIIVERTPVAQNGQLVVAMVDNSATVKRYFKENGRFRLQPENDAMQPILVDSVEILGRVVSVQRYY